MLQLFITFLNIFSRCPLSFPLRISDPCRALSHSRWLQWSQRYWAGWPSTPICFRSMLRVTCEVFQNHRLCTFVFCQVECQRLTTALQSIQNRGDEANTRKKSFCAFSDSDSCSHRHRPIWRGEPGPWLCKYQIYLRLKAAIGSIWFNKILCIFTFLDLY